MPAQAETISSTKKDRTRPMGFAFPMAPDPSQLPQR
jgi:hypothetical protein